MAKELSKNRLVNCYPFGAKIAAHFQKSLRFCARNSLIFNCSQCFIHSEWKNDEYSNFICIPLFRTHLMCTWTSGRRMVQQQNAYLGTDTKSNLFLKYSQNDWWAWNHPRYYTFYNKMFGQSLKLSLTCLCYMIDSDPLFSFLNIGASKFLRAKYSQNRKTRYKPIKLHSIYRKDPANKSFHFFLLDIPVASTHILLSFQCIASFSILWKNSIRFFDLQKQR